MAQGSILNNIPAIGASRQLGISQAGLDKTIQRLTSGKRINQAADDAAGLAISNRLGADIRISTQGRRNAMDGIAYLAVADGALDEVTNLLTRAAELTQQSKTGTVSASNREAIDLEFQAITKAITNVATNAKFNGQTVFVSGTTLFAAVANYSNITISVGTMAGSTSLTSSDLKTVTAAAAAEKLIEKAIQDVSMQRASIGANMQSLNTISNTLGIQVENFTAAFSQIRDANIADEVVNLTKYQILMQSGTSALGQANQTSQMVLALLR